MFKTRQKIKFTYSCLSYFQSESPFPANSRNDSEGKNVLNRKQETLKDIAYRSNLFIFISLSPSLSLSLALSLPLTISLSEASLH